MEIKILQVFYGKDGLPYKDKDRQVHFPIAGTGFLGASKTTKIKFYYDELDNLDETTWVAVSKLPNGKVGSRVLESYLDEELNEHYALLELDNYYTQYKGDVFISLQGYQGGVDFDYDEENSQYEIYGTPTIAATGSIKFTINYANQFVGSGETDNINFQRILAALGTKLGMRAYSEHVEELPSEGSPDVFYVVNDDPNDPNIANIYVWNENTRHYIWVGDNTLDLGNYYTKDQGINFENDINESFEDFEQTVNDKVQNVEIETSSLKNQVQSLANGSPKGVYATLSDLQTDNPDHDYIYVVTANNNWYYWNGSAWTSGGEYLSGDYTGLESSIELLQKDNQEINGIELLEPTAIISNTALSSNPSSRGSYGNSNYDTYRYTVKAGDKIRLRALTVMTNVALSVWQFQTTASLPSTDSNPYIVGSTHTTPYEGYLEVPENATQLYLTVAHGDTESGIYYYKKIQDAIEDTDNKAEKNQDRLIQLISHSYPDTFNGSLGNDGIIHSSASGVCLYVKLEEGEKYILYRSINDMYNFDFVFADEPKVNGNSTQYKLFNGGGTIQYGDKEIELTVPTNYPYLVINLYNSNEQTYTLTELINAIEVYKYDLIFKKLNDIDDLYDNVIKNKVLEIENKTTSKALMMCVITDSHIDSKRLIYFEELCEHAKKINNVLSIDYTIHLGDLINGAENSKADGKKFLSIGVKNLLNIGGKKTFVVVGNHEPNDFADVSYTLDEQELYGCIQRFNEEYVNRLNISSNYYFDEDTMKIRFIFIDGIYQTHGFSQETLTWITNTLSSAPSDYHFVLFCHEATRWNLMSTTSYEMVNGEEMEEILSQYEERIYGYFFGHSHFDNVSYVNNFPEISIACSQPYKYPEDNMPTGATSPNRTIGTTSQDCFDIVLILPNEQKFELIRIGAGSSRTIAFREE